MYNPIRFNFGGKIIFNDRSNKPAVVSLLDTSNVVEIRDYSYNLEPLDNSPYPFAFTQSNYALETENYGSGLYNRHYLHPTESVTSLSVDPTKNFTLARPNSFFNLNAFYNNNLTFDIRISFY